jgi:hypothetical protein
LNIIVTRRFKFLPIETFLFDGEAEEDEVKKLEGEGGRDDPYSLASSRDSAT